MNIHTSISIVLVVVLVVAKPLQSQEAQAPRYWSAALYYDAQQMEQPGGHRYWHTLTAGVQRKHETGSIGVQAVTARRFDINDQALVADLYQNLWARAYGNLFVRYGIDAEVLPSFDAGAELFQTLGRVELGTSYRYQEVALSEVGTVGLGVAYYHDQWYLRPRIVTAHINNSWAPSMSVTARRYLNQSTDSSIDFVLGYGEEVLEVVPATGSNDPVDVVTSGSRTASIRTQRFFGRHVGATAGVTFSDYFAIEDRWGVSFGLMTRW